MLLHFEYLNIVCILNEKGMTQSTLLENRIVSRYTSGEKEDEEHLDSCSGVLQIIIRDLSITHG